MGRHSRRDSEPDVKVYHPAKGCELDGRRDEHIHTQAAHRAHLDRTGDPVTGKGDLKSRWSRR